MSGTLTCVTGPGEMLLLPDEWIHATCGLTDTWPRHAKTCACRLRLCRKELSEGQCSGPLTGAMFQLSPSKEFTAAAGGWLAYHDD